MVLRFSECLLVSKWSKQYTIRGVQIRAFAIHFCMDMCHNNNTCHVYVMWVVLGQKPFNFLKHNVGSDVSAFFLSSRNGHLNDFKGFFYLVTSDLTTAFLL